MKTLRLLVMATLLLSACTPTTYYRADTTQADFDRDSAQCQAQALSGAGLSSNLASAGIAGIHQGQIMQLCMKGKGYTTKP